MAELEKEETEGWDTHDKNPVETTDGEEAA